MSLETEFHTELEQRTAEWLQLRKLQPLINFRLPSGKIADIICISTNNVITIVEVKTTLSVSLVEQAIVKYSPYCNQLYMAAPLYEVTKLRLISNTYEWPRSHARIGMLSLTDRSAIVSQEAGSKLILTQTKELLAYQIRHHLQSQEIPISGIAIMVKSHEPETKRK